MELQAIWIGPEDNGDSDYVQSIQVNTQYIAIGTSNSEIILLTSDGEYVRTIYDEQLAARRFTTEKAVLIMVLTHDRLLYSGIDGMLRVRDLSTG